MGITLTAILLGSLIYGFMMVVRLNTLFDRHQDRLRDLRHHLQDYLMRETYDPQATPRADAFLAKSAVNDNVDAMDQIYPEVLYVLNIERQLKATDEPCKLFGMKVDNTVA